MGAMYDRSGRKADETVRAIKRTMALHRVKVVSVSKRFSVRCEGADARRGKSKELVGVPDVDLAVMAENPPELVVGPGLGVTCFRPSLIELCERCRGRG